MGAALASIEGPIHQQDSAGFLDRYWQQQPLLLRGALPASALPGALRSLDGDELAGLAMEEDVESRLVSGALGGDPFEVRWGPLTELDFASLGPRDWTLLVTDVDKHLPETAGLFDAFRFLPDWRLDDLMLSFAVAGGSVGPHVDEYDVFLLQLRGHRRWSLAAEYDPARAEHPDLDLLNHFEAETEAELGPGDMLYLPPGVAHHGVALDDCLTASIGFRAPSLADWLAFLAEQFGQRGDGGGRWRDPQRHPASGSELQAADLDRLQLLERGLGRLTGSQRGRLFAEFQSSYRLAREPEPLETPLDEAGLDRVLASDGVLIRSPWTRFCCHIESQQAHFYAAGQYYQASPAAARLVGRLRRIDQQAVSEFEGQASELRALLLQLCNDGHLALQ